MDFLNHTLNSFSAQVSDLAVGLNPDIFETNVINITIFLVESFTLVVMLYRLLLKNVNRKF